MIITHKLKMNLEEEVTQRLEMPVGDVSSRSIQMLLYSRQSPWAVPDNVTVLVRYQKPDGTRGEYDTMPDGTAAWFAADNALTILVAPQVLTAAGNVALCAEIYLEEKILHTFAVEICVKTPFGKSRGVSAESQDYCYVTGILRGPATAKPGQILIVEAVDTYGRVTKVEAQDAAALVGAKGDAVLYTQQALTEAQQAQARENIGALEQPLRTEYSKTKIFRAEADAFVDVNGKGVYTYGGKLSWLNDYADFDFRFCVELDGETYSFYKKDCIAIDLGGNGAQRWWFNTDMIPNCDTILSLGNGMDPLTGALNNTLSFACETGKAVWLEFYKADPYSVAAKPVITINGKKPDENGNIVMPKLYSAQVLTERQKAQARANIHALEAPTRPVPAQEHITVVKLSNFTEENGWYIYAPGKKKSWLNSVDDFDFNLELAVFGRNYTITKADCTITELGTGENHAWIVCHPEFEGSLFQIGNGLHPVSYTENNQYSFAFSGYYPSTFRLSFNRNYFEWVDVPVVTTVNGVTPDENGNVEAFALSVLCTEQSFSPEQQRQARQNIGAVSAYDLSQGIELEDGKNSTYHTLSIVKGKLEQFDKANNKVYTFLTDADEQRIIDATIAALPIYNGEVEEV